MRKVIFALAILSAHTFSAAQGNQDSTSLGGAVGGLVGMNRLFTTQTASGACPAGYDGEILYVRSVVGGVAEPWRESSRSCRTPPPSTGQGRYQCSVWADDGNRPQLQGYYFSHFPCLANRNGNY